MGFRAQRLGFSIGRGWTLLLLIIGGLVAASFWIGPLRPLPAELELLAVSGDIAVPEIEVRGHVTEQGQVRFAVPLAVRNIGARPTRPRQLMLSVPAQYNVAAGRGQLTAEVTAGVPLRRYSIDLDAPTLEPARTTVRMSPIDTVWLEPSLPRFYCTVSDVGVPEFVPAPAYDPEMLSNVRIYYSFAAASPSERHTGLLTVHVDPSMLRVQPAAMPPSFPTVFEESTRGLPVLGTLHQVGTRTAWCGDPQRPNELYSVLWETNEGGRFFMVHSGGEVRKHLYDLNMDGIVELETWDADGDEHFEARREARFAVPDFLLPLPPRHPEMLLPDTTRPDSSWLAVFHDRSAGPWRFAAAERARIARAERDARARLDSIASAAARIAADSMAALDSVADAAAPAAPAAPVATAGPDAAAGAPAVVALDPAADLRPVEPPTAEWLRLFGNTAAGPFRFSRVASAAAPGGTGAADAGAGEAAGADAAGDVAGLEDVAADSIAEEEPPRREPLGTPIPYPRRDTIRDSIF